MTWTGDSGLMFFEEWHHSSRTESPASVDWYLAQCSSELPDYWEMPLWQEFDTNVRDTFTTGYPYGNITFNESNNLTFPATLGSGVENDHSSLVVTHTGSDIMITCAENERVIGDPVYDWDSWQGDIAQYKDAPWWTTMWSRVLELEGGFKFQSDTSLGLIVFLIYDLGNFGDATTPLTLRIKHVDGGVTQYQQQLATSYPEGSLIDFPEVFDFTHRSHMMHGLGYWNNKRPFNEITVIPPYQSGDIYAVDNFTLVKFYELKTRYKLTPPPRHKVIPGSADGIEMPGTTSDLPFPVVMSNVAPNSFSIPEQVTGGTFPTRAGIITAYDVGLGDNTPLPEWPNSTAAYNEWLGKISPGATLYPYSFEDLDHLHYAYSDPIEGIDFGGGITATLSGLGRIVDITELVPPRPSNRGRYPTDGDKYLTSSGGLWQFDFSENISMFSIFTTDLGEEWFASQFEITLSTVVDDIVTRSQVIYSEYLAQGASGSVRFFGIYNSVPFNRISFENVIPNMTDQYGFDYVTIATPNQVKENAFPPPAGVPMIRERMTQKDRDPGYVCGTGTGLTAQGTYYGYDLNINAPDFELHRLQPEDRVNSTEAYNSFVANFTDFGVETFESFDDGDEIGPGDDYESVPFGGYLTGTVTSGGTIDEIEDVLPPDVNTNFTGCYPITGTKFLYLFPTHLAMTFPEPVAAVAAWFTDIGDYSNADFGFTVTYVGGETETIVTPELTEEVQGVTSASGSCMFVGFYSISKGIIGVDWNLPTNSEVMGVDNFIVAKKEDTIYSVDCPVRVYEPPSGITVANGIQMPGTTSDLPFPPVMSNVTPSSFPYQDGLEIIVVDPEQQAHEGPYPVGTHRRRKTTH